MNIFDKVRYTFLFQLMADVNTWILLVAPGGYREIRESKRTRILVRSLNQLNHIKNFQEYL